MEKSFSFLQSLSATKQRNLGMLAVALCAICWSTGGLFIKFVTANPLVIAGGRSFLALLVLLVFRGMPRFTGSLVQIGAGVLNAITMILFITANKLTTSANSILLQYAAPVYVAILAVIFLREKLRPRDLVALIAVLVGVILFFLEQVSPGNLWGNIFAALSGLTFAGFFILMRMQKEGSTVESFMISHIITVLVSVPFWFWNGFDFTLQNSVALCLLGFVQIGVASLLFSFGIKHVPAINAALIATLEPILNPVWVFLVTGELPTPLALAGGAVIVVAVTALQVVDILKPFQKADSDSH